MLRTGNAGANTAADHVCPTSTFAQTSRLTDSQRELLAVTGIQPPSRITALRSA